MSELTELEKINGCFAILVNEMLASTNATHAKLESDLSYKGKPLGRYKLEITKLPKKGLE